MKNTSKLTVAEDLDIAYAKPLRVQDVARSNNVSSQTARVSQIVVASSFLEAQLNMLRILKAKCTTETPLYAAEVLKYDEAKCSAACDLFSGLERSLCRANLAWSILLSKRLVIIGWPNGEMNMFPFALPPQLVFQCTSGAMEDALFNQRHVKDIVSEIGGILQSASTAVRIRGRDDASSGVKLCASEAMKR